MLVSFFYIPVKRAIVNFATCIMVLFGCYAHLVPASFLLRMQLLEAYRVLLVCV